MFNVSRIGENYLYGCTQDKSLSLQIGNRFGIWGSKKLGGGYLSGEINKACAIGGVAVGVYYWIFNLQAMYISGSFVQDDTYKVIGQLYIGLAIEFEF